MERFRKIENLQGTANSNDRLIEGFLLVLDNEEFHIFVEDELTGSKRGYILKLMYKDGKDNLVNLNNVKQFPQVNMIFDKFCQGLWVNQRNAKKCYKYIVFGKRVKDKIFAVTIMRHIVCDILLASQIK